jgi:hypothetical protein
MDVFIINMSQSDKTERLDKDISRGGIHGTGTIPPVMRD